MDERQTDDKYDRRSDDKPFGPEVSIGLVCDVCHKPLFGSANIFCTTCRAPLCEECSHKEGCDEKSASAVYGPLANEMLVTTADYGDPESVHDCLATLADRLVAQLLACCPAKLEAVVYGVESIGAKATDLRLMLEDWHEQATILSCLCGHNPGKVLDDIAEYLSKAIVNISPVGSHSDKLSDPKVPPTS